jgi:three-Cys-motif partner protein
MGLEVPGALENGSTLGPIQPHTEAKHDILRYHLGAWFPILGRSSSGPLQYIDGFAGPGEYEGGQVGSPILALNVVANHRYVNDFIQAGRRFDFLFVEKEQRFHDHLRDKVSGIAWPNAFNIAVRHDEFETVMRERLNEVDAGKRRMPPTLLLIDPFGPAGFSMELIARLARYSMMDVLINFNYADLVRWILPDRTKHVTLDRLYGGRRWLPALGLDGNDRREFLIQQYGLALLAAGWRGTNFEMINRQNQTQYHLFFATRHFRGMLVMKGAMRSVSPDGLFRYRDRTDPAQQRFMGMGMDEEYAQELASHLSSKYRGQGVTKETLVEDEVAWHPRWIEKDLTAALRLLENSTPPKITGVCNADGRPRRRNFYPAGCVITFA